MIDIINLKQAPQHLITLARWHQREWSTLNPGETLEQRVARMQGNLNHEFLPVTYVALDTAVKGSASIVINDMDCRPQFSPWLASVFVANEYRSNGIGSNLVLHTMLQAKKQGITMLYLFTADRTHFYQRLGWHEIDIEQYHGQCVTIMQVNLNHI